MDFQINPLSYRDVFTLPVEVAERLRLAGDNHLRFILWVYSSKNTEISLEAAAKELRISTDSAEESVLFWQEAGLLLVNGETIEAPQKKERQKTKISQQVEELSKPTKSEAVKRASEDTMLRAAVPEIQKKLSRTINSNELISFVWMHDSLGLPIEVILTLIEVCVSEEKTNIRYMEKLANDWASKDIDTLEKAEKMLKERMMRRKAWGKVQRAFGIDSRKPSDNELEFSNRWINEWEFSSAMLKAAYNVCIDAKTKLNFRYINGVLGSWHEQGFKNVDDIVAEKTVSKDTGKSSIDIDEFSKLLDSKRLKKGDA